MHLVFFSSEAANFIALRNYLFFELCFVPPVIKVTTLLDMELLVFCLFVFSSRERPTGLHRTFSNGFLGDLA